MAKFAFVQNLSFEYLGVMYLSSLLKAKGHKVEVFIEHGQGKERLISELVKYGPQIVGFSCTTGSHIWAKQVALCLKARLKSCLIVFGGAHPTFFPEIINEEGVDIICRGEGEYALVELAEHIDRNADFRGILNLWVKAEGEITRNEVRPLIEHLDELPFPDRSLYISKYPFLKKSQKTFILARGCPFSCSYCFNHALKKIYHNKGSFVRYRSQDNVLAEMRQVKAEYSPRTMYIQDDTFGLNKPWAREFLLRYKKEVSLPFICLLRADLVDAQSINDLKGSGCISAFFGIESGDENLRNLILKKRLTDEQIYKCAKLLKQEGIRFRTYNMFGLPGETLKEAFKTVELNIKIKTDYPWSSLFQPFPGTELGEYVKEHKMLMGEGDCFEPSFFKKSAVKLEQRKEIENLHRLFFFAVKFPAILPLVRRAVKIKFNSLFNLLFLLGYFYSFKQSENLSFLETSRIGFHNVRNFIFNRKN